MRLVCFHRGSLFHHRSIDAASCLSWASSARGLLGGDAVAVGSTRSPRGIFATDGSSFGGADDPPYLALLLLLDERYNMVLIQGNFLC